MRRGGVLILLIGLILVVGAGAFFFLLQTPGGSVTENGQPVLPSEEPDIDIVVARVDIPANTVIDDAETLLRLVPVAASTYDPNENFTNITDVRGQLTTRSFNRDQPITKSGLTEPGLSQQIPTAEPDRPRDKAYPFQVNSLSGVADQIKPGDFVDVVATFRVPRRVSYPTARRLEEQAGQTVPVTERELTDPEFSTTKTIVQQAQVLRIQRPSPTADGTVTPEAERQGPPETTADGQPITAADDVEGGSEIRAGNWVLVLAINNQEAELFEFALSTNAEIALVLRGAGDADFEPTIGATFDLLVSEFGVPLPRPLSPRIFGEDEVFTADPTRTPAPTRVP